MAEYDGVIKLGVDLEADSRTLKKTVSDMGKQISSVFKSFSGGADKATSSQMRLQNQIDKTTQKIINLEKQQSKASGAISYTKEYTKMGKDLEKVMSQAEKLQEKLTELRKKRDELDEKQIFTDDYAKSGKDLNRVKNSLDRLAEKLTQLEVEGQKAGKSIQQIYDSKEYVKTEQRINRLKTTLRQIAVERKQMRDSGQAFIDPTTTEKYKELELEIGKLESEFDNSIASAKELRDTMKEMQVSGANIDNSGIERLDEQINTANADLEVLKKRQEESSTTGVTMADRIRKAFSKLTGVVKGFGNFLAKHIDDRFKKLARTAQTNMAKVNRSFSLGRVLRYAVGIESLFTLFHKLKSLGIEAFKVLARQSNKVNKQISSMVSSFYTFRNSMATTFQPLLNVIVPVVNKVLSIMTSAMTKIGEFFAVLTGQKYIYKATKANVDYAKSLDKSTGSSKKKNKEDKKQLAFYDELDVIQKNEKTPDTGTGGSGAADDMIGGFEKADPTKAVSEFAKKIKEAWAKSDFTEIGTILGTKLKNALDSIPWDDIKKNASNLGKDLGTLINGFVEVDGLGTSLGKTIAEGINTAFIFIDKFLTTTHWNSVGKFFADIFNSLGTIIDFEKVGKTIADAFNAIFEVLYNFLNNLDVEAIMTNIVNGLNKFVDVVDLELIGKTIATGLNKILDGLNTFAKKFDFKKLGTKITKGISAFFKTFKWSKISSTLSHWISGLFDFIAGLIDGIEWKELPKNVVTAIIDFFKGVDWKKLFGSIGNLAFTFVKACFNFGVGIGNLLKEGYDKIVEYFNGWIDKFEENGEPLGIAIIHGLLAGIGNALLNIVTWLADNVGEPIVNAFKDVFGIHSPSKVFSDLGSLLIDGLLQGIVDTITSIPETIEKKVSEIVESIKTFFSEIDWSAIGESVGNAFSGIKDKFTGIWDSIKEPFDKVKEWFSKKFSEAYDTTYEAFANIGTKFEEIRDKVKEPFKKIAAWFSEKFSTAWENVKEAFDKVKEFFEGVWKKIKEPFGKIADWFKDKFSKAWEGVKVVFSAGGKVFTGIKDGILKGLKTVINALIEGINKVVKVPFDGLNFALKKIKEVKIGKLEPFKFIEEIKVPQIPKLAQGAVIPPNKEFLAMLGDQKSGTNIETPLKTMIEAFKTALDERGGNNEPIILSVDGRTLAKVVWDENEKRYKQTGYAY